MQRLKINQIKMNTYAGEQQLEEKILKILKIEKKNLISFKIVKKSIDARKKPDIFYVYAVEVCVNNVSKNILKNKDIQVVDKHKKYNFICSGTNYLNSRPVIAGFGPAGMFCGYMLAKNGYNPIIIERGCDVDTRIKKVDHFWETGELDTESNIQFGEGGAGTFSDGKLNTTVNDKLLRNRLVLETLVEFGAPENILYDSKPHIGTDILCNVVKNIRNYIIKHGGKILFEKKLTGIEFEGDKLTSIIVNENEKIDCQVLILAIGHSARDTFTMLNEIDVKMEQKPFAVGIRVEHLQETINRSMYGKGYDTNLPASPYKLTAKSSDGRGVYSFCMCPGGYVVNASSEKGMTVVNGMSYSRRDGKNANSAIVTTVTPDDFKGESPLAGMYFQQELERKAFMEGNGDVPVQLFGDFKKNTVTKEFGRVTPSIKGKFKMSNLKNILPEYVSTAIEECMPKFAKSIEGFDKDDTVFSAIESRTSSPVRIVRDENCESLSIKGLYPCGEGAGYAGGITSAAIDGVKVFEAVASKYYL